MTIVLCSLHKAIKIFVHRIKQVHVCMSVLSVRHVCWPRHMLPPGESRWVWQLDRQTNGRTPDRYITLSARCGQRNKRLRWELVALKWAVNVINETPMIEFCWWHCISLRQHTVFARTIVADGYNFRQHGISAEEAKVWFQYVILPTPPALEQDNLISI